MKLVNILLFICLIAELNSLTPKLFPLEQDSEPNESKSKVFMIKDLRPDSIVKMYKQLGAPLKGNIALKIHSGEPDGPYFLRPVYLHKIFNYTNGTFVECNTAYTGKRYTTELHKETIEINQWEENGRKFDIMDPNEEEERVDIEPHQKIQYNYVGKHLFKYDSCLVLSHFKGHAMGGFGGALKQLSIGYASRGGKTFIHTAGQTTNYTELFAKEATPHDFTTSMADAASSIIKYFKNQNKGGVVYINVLKDISIDCDCAGKDAKIPKINDIGILGSFDPVAIDQASFELIKQSGDEGVDEWLQRVTEREGENTLKVAEELGIGTRKYELVEISSGSLTKVSFIVFGLLLCLF